MKATLDRYTALYENVVLVCLRVWERRIAVLGARSAPGDTGQPANGSGWDIKGGSPRLVLVGMAAVGSLLATVPVLAHHSFAAEFDSKQPVKLMGALTKIEWVNPHAWLYIDVQDQTGQVANWALELGSPNHLLRLGWTRHSLKPGDVITAEGSRARDGSTVANARSIVFNGKRMFAGSSQRVTP